VKYNGDTIRKAEPVLYYLSKDVGEFDISVTCYTESDGRLIASGAYSGKVSHVADVTKKYNWMYQGKEYTASVTFNYDDYRDYRNMKTNGRDVTNYRNSISFITHDDPAIESLTASLSNAYGNTAKDQNFASYLLAFVQICFDYPPFTDTMEADRYQYGQREYFAYPLETIFCGMGDCEDTSILAAAIFKAAGFNAGVVIVPGHALAAVGLSSYSPGTYQSWAYEVISSSVRGVTYYACETTVDSPQGRGLVTLNTGNDIYGGPLGPFSTYIGKDGNGFYIV
jgi:transglutaminase-like putative cysteine protease